MLTLGFGFTPLENRTDLSFSGFVCFASECCLGGPEMGEGGGHTLLTLEFGFTPLENRTDLSFFGSVCFASGCPLGGPPRGNSPCMTTCLENSGASGHA